jgi:hypothetical protein
MPLIPILLSDSARQVEYKIHLTAQVAAEQEALVNLGRWRDYFNGDQPLLLSDDQQAFVDYILSPRGSYPIDNKVRTVVNKLRRRVNCQGFVMPDTPAAEMKVAQAMPQGAASAAEWAWLWWHLNKMDSGERSLYESAIRDAWAYVVVSHDGSKPVFHVEERWDGVSGIRFFWDDDRLRRAPLYAVKYWYTKDPLLVTNNVQRITLYTADAVYKWARLTSKQAPFFNVVGWDDEDKTLAQVMDDGDTEWPVRWTDSGGAPLGLAVVPFVSPFGSIVDGLIGLQDALNKTWVDVIVNADQQGFGQIAVEYEDRLPTVTTTATGNYGSTVIDDDGYGMRPGRIMEVLKARVHKLPADDMAGLHNTLRLITTAIAANTEMPLHYFIPLSGEVPSGAALDELSKPVGELAEELTVAWSDSWREVMALGMKLDRQYGSYRGEPAAVMPVWKPQPKTPETEANALAPLEAATRAIGNLVAAGATIQGAATTVGEMLGLSPDAIEMLVRGDAVDGIEP